MPIIMAITNIYITIIHYRSNSIYKLTAAMFNKVT